MIVRAVMFVACAALVGSVLLAANISLDGVALLLGHLP